MSEERNNAEVIPEFKMYITDLETERKSKEINVSDLIFNDYIQFEFGDYEDEDYIQLPYKDFKFFINDYSVTFYSPQIKDLQQKVEQLENIIKEATEYMKEFIFEPLLINEDRKLIMFNENLKNFENILNKGENSNGK